jgi:hypothetical protein
MEKKTPDIGIRRIPERLGANVPCKDPEAAPVGFARLMTVVGQAQLASNRLNIGQAAQL